MKLRFATLLLLLLPLAAAAQTQFVTVIGSNTNYKNGIMTANFFPPAGSSQFDYLKGHFPFTVTGYITSSGSWNFSVADTSSVFPAGSQWQLQMCSPATFGAATCYTVTQPVTCINNVSCSGTTLDLTSAFSGAPVPPGGGGGTINWPAIKSIIISNNTNSPAGLAEVDGDCVVGVSGSWVASSCAGAAVSITSAASTLSLSPSPLTGTGTIDINLANANTWTAAQTFNLGITVPSTGTITLGTNDSIQHSSAGGLAFGQGGTQGMMLAGTGKDLRVLDNGDYAFTSALNVGPDTTITRPAAGAVAIGTFYNNNGTMDFQQWNATPVTITSSATPAVGTSSLQTITLSANATPTFTIATGEILTIEICQPATGGPYTWTWPASVHGGMTIGTTASTCSIQSFASFNGTTLVQTTPGAANVAP